MNNHDKDHRGWRKHQGFNKRKDQGAAVNHNNQQLQLNIKGKGDFNCRPEKYDHLGDEPNINTLNARWVPLKHS